MTAREKFKKGDRVWYKPSKGEKVTSPFGTVVGFSHHKDFVAVLRDERKTRDAWHMDFWEVVR